MHILSNTLLKFLIVVHALTECKFGDTSGLLCDNIAAYHCLKCLLFHIQFSSMLYKIKLCKNSILEIYFKYTNAAVCCKRVVLLYRFNVLPFIGLADNKFSAEGGNRVTFKSLCHYIDCVIQVIIPVDSLTNFHLLSKILFKLLLHIS